MKPGFAFLSLALVAARAGAAVVELTSKNFDKTIAQTPDSHWLLVFHAPWCGHCKALSPVLEELSQLHEPEVMVAKIDATIHKALAARFDVDGYPSLYHITARYRDVRKYTASRDLDHLSAWVVSGFLQQKKILYLKSPFGPMGRIKGFLIQAGSFVLDLQAYLVQQHGLSDLMACLVLMGACTTAAFVLVLVLAVTTAPAAPPRRPHRD